jgi:hypothetical protein
MNYEQQIKYIMNTRAEEVEKNVTFSARAIGDNSLKNITELVSEVKYWFRNGIDAFGHMFKCVFSLKKISKIEIGNHVRGIVYTGRGFKYGKKDDHQADTYHSDIRKADWQTLAYYGQLDFQYEGQLCRLNAKSYQEVRKEIGLSHNPKYLVADVADRLADEYAVEKTETAVPSIS